MTQRGGSLRTSPTLARVSMGAMALAVLALGGLAMWSTAVARDSAADLTRSGVQITGQLRSVQALYVVRTESELLQDELTDEGLARLRAALRALPEDLARMQDGNSPEAARVARQAMPVAERLGPAVERFLADPRGDVRYHGEDGDDTAEDAMEDLVEQLEQLLNDAGSDPARLLSTRLDAATDAGDAVRRTTGGLVPLGLAGVAAAALLLRRYRRLADAAVQRLLETNARDARTDQLTGLPNRRALLEELHRRVGSGERFTFALADLNGFKHYNDTFGHPAGDALLRRLGHKLDAAFGDGSFAARLGGDEFCVISAESDPGRLQATLHGALGEQGEGFEISAVSGLARVPDETADADAVLGLADTRLYAAKAVFYAAHPHVRGESGRPDTAVALAIDGDRPHLAADLRLDPTVQVAVTCAELLGLSPADVALVERAAQLHDIGKAALPAAILAKHGTLTEEEWSFVRRHTAIGERLLNGVEDLEPVAAVVRAAQERWDGDGYPDQLAGDRIPVGSRIVAVASAFVAMTSDRPHAPARSVADAMVELDRCSGTQFDPAVVAAISTAVSRRADGVAAGTQVGAWPTGGYGGPRA